MSFFKINIEPSTLLVLLQYFSILFLFYLICGWGMLIALKILFKEENIQGQDSFFKSLIVWPKYSIILLKLILRKIKDK